MRYFFTWLFFAVFTTLADGQVLINDFLNSAFESAEVKSAQAQLSYLQTKPYKLSPLQKLEFRTQVREMSLDKQEYAFRLQPANPWEMKNNNQYFKDYQSYLSSESQLALKEALKERYLVLAEYIYFTELKKISDEQVLHIEKQLAVLERQITSSFFDADEYVDLKVEHLDKVSERENAAFELLNQEAIMNKLYPAMSGRSIVLNAEKLITVARIEKVIDSLRLLEVNSALVAYHQQKLKVDNSRYNLEKSNVNVGFLQAEYDERRVEQNRVPYTIGMGVTIPITNPNKSDMARQKLNAIETEYELKKVEESEKVNSENSFARVKEMIAQYKMLESRITEMEKSTLADNLSLLKGGDPLIRIKYEYSINKLHVLEAKIKRKVYTYYIESLADSDFLQKSPLVNYLSGDLSPLQGK